MAPASAIELEDRLSRVSLSDLEAVRVVLRGSSTVDWHRMAFRDQEDVDRFLRVNELDPENDRDMERLEALREQAVDYLSRNFDFRISDEIAEEISARELFLVASRRSRRQVHACVVLKVMHIIHHLAGRELVFRLPISDDDLFRLVERKVVHIVDELRASGHPVVEFEWSRKPRDSLITKLLAKRSTQAAGIYDKLRFRLVARSTDDLLPMLVEMTRRLFPFNYVVPGESRNDLVSFKRVAERSPHVAEIVGGLQDDPTGDAAEAESTQTNEFSGPSYRIINFVADLPIRIDGLLARIGDPGFVEHGPVGFVLTEFQIVDARTAQENEHGENSHEKYKERQYARVRQRLLRGLATGDPHSPPERGRGGGGTPSSEH